MSRPKGAVSARHHHVLRTDPETNREVYGPRLQTLAVHESPSQIYRLICSDARPECAHVVCTYS